MNEKVKAKWLKALRGGKYKQGRGSLNCDGYFCCLGVLCDILGAEWVDDHPEIGGKRIGDYCLPARHFTELLGLSNSQIDKLADMNDDNFGRPQSFRQIANYIEKNL